MARTWADSPDRPGSGCKPAPAQFRKAYFSRVNAELHRHDATVIQTLPAEHDGLINLLLQDNDASLCKKSFNKPSRRRHHRPSDCDARMQEKADMARLGTGTTALWFEQLDAWEEDVTVALDNARMHETLQTRCALMTAHKYRIDDN